MCGISGFYSKSLSSFDNVILKMNATIAHRGPERKIREIKIFTLVIKDYQYWI